MARMPGWLTPQAFAAARGDIAVVELPPRAVYSGQCRRLRESAKHAALVIVTFNSAPVGDTNNGITGWSKTPVAKVRES